jgi:IS1 family transposase
MKFCWDRSGSAKFVQGNHFSNRLSIASFGRVSNAFFKFISVVKFTIVIFGKCTLRGFLVNSFRLF